MTFQVMAGGHVLAETVVHPLSLTEASAICEDLHAAGIDVAIRLAGGIAHVTALAELSTAQEVAALRAVIDHCDGPVHWHDPDVVTAVV